MNEYTYTAYRPGIIAAHAGHTWEEWHGYLSDLTDAPDYVNGNSSGLCCHSCRTVILDS